MSEWLLIGMHGVFVGRHGADPLKFRDADERRRHSQLHHLAQSIGGCLRELVRLRPWQTAGGLEHQLVVIDPVLTEVDRPTVGRIWRRDDPAYEGVWCELRLPLAWREGPVDGVRSIQLFRAVLLALDGVGEQFGLGPMPVAKPPKKPVEAEDPFHAPDARRREAIESATTWLAAKVDSLHPGQAIVAARAEGPAWREPRRTGLVEGLGELVEHEKRVMEDGKGAALWVVHANW